MKEQIERRIKHLQRIVDNNRKQQFLSHNGIIIETVIHELKETLKHQ